MPTVFNNVSFQYTWALEVKFTPVTFMLKSGPPEFTVAGAKVVIDGILAAARIVKILALEVPLLVVGFTTVTVAVPALAKSAVGTTTVSRVLVSVTVVSCVLFHITCESAAKFVPVIIRL